MKRFIFLAILCSLALGMGAQTAKEEIFADVHRSAANYYAYPVPSVEQTAPPAGYKPFYLSHYARHGSRFLINPEWRAHGVGKKDALHFGQCLPCRPKQIW